MLKHALATKGLKIVFGADAVAGAHGRNAEEFIDRVQAGQPPLDALTASHSRAAESLNMQNEIGAIAPGMQADIIALDGDPLKDITTVRRVVFVMKGGKVYRNEMGSSQLTGAPAATGDFTLNVGVTDSKKVSISKLFKPKVI